MTITKSTLIMDVVNKYPQIVDQLLSYGVHCIGCFASHFETIEQGLQVHGKSNQEIDKIIKELNQSLKNETKINKKNKSRSEENS